MKCRITKILTTPESLIDNLKFSLVLKVQHHLLNFTLVMLFYGNSALVTILAIGNWASSLYLKKVSVQALLNIFINLLKY